MSTALYRRYRPDSFADVIGQEHVTTPLMAALSKNRVNHAYLFSGPRGCGKTTSARILARCLNCEQGPTDTPCGECASCRDLATGGPGSLDVIEIDAASHGGVDDARDLRERATFAPTRDRYKIFIIDEAHMVTSAGFNALLKIVEEPPEHIKFVFATTEPDKVIGTIRSRTHHYPFRLVPPETLMEYLERLCQQENVPVAPGVLSLVLRAGGGSVRDTLSVLDQLMAGAGSEGLDYELAVSLLGYTHAALLDDVVDALAAQDAATVFSAVDRVIQTGHDPRRFVEDLLERLRDLIIVKAMPDAAAQILRGVPADQLARMQQQAAILGQAELSRAADVTNQALTEMTGATSPRLHLELLCARLLLPSSDPGERGIGARVDRIERRLTYGGTEPLTDGTGGQGTANQDESGTAVHPGAEAGATGAAAVREALRAAKAKQEPAADAPAVQAEQKQPSAPQVTEPQPQAPAQPEREQPSAPQVAEPEPQAPEQSSAQRQESHQAPAPEANPAEAASSGAAEAAQSSADSAESGAPRSTAQAAFPKTAEELASRLPQRQEPRHQEEPTADWGGAWTVPDADALGSTAVAPEPQQEPARQQAAEQQPDQRSAQQESAAPAAVPQEPARAPEAEPQRQAPQNPQPSAEQTGPRVGQAQQPAEQPSGPQEQAAPQPAPSPQSGGAASGGAGSIEMFRRAWPEVLEVIKNERKVVWMNLQQNASLTGFDGRTLALGFAHPGAMANFQRLNDNVALVQWAVHQVLGVQVGIDVVAGGSADAGGSGPKADRRPQPASAGSDSARPATGRPAPTSGRSANPDPGVVPRPEAASRPAPQPFQPTPQRQEHYERPEAPQWTDFPPIDASSATSAAESSEESAPDAGATTSADSASASTPTEPTFEGNRASAVSPVEAAGTKGHSSHSAMSAASAHSASSAASADAAAPENSAAPERSAASAPAAAPQPAPAPSTTEPDDGWIPPEEPPEYDEPYDAEDPSWNHASEAPASSASGTSATTSGSSGSAATAGSAASAASAAPSPAAPVIPPAPAGPTPPPPSWAGSALPSTMRQQSQEKPAAPAPERRDPAKKLSRYQQLLAQAEAENGGPSGGGWPGGSPRPTGQPSAAAGAESGSAASASTPADGAPPAAGSRPDAAPDGWGHAGTPAPNAGAASTAPAPGAESGQAPNQPQGAANSGAAGRGAVNSSYGAVDDADFVPSDDDIAIEDSTVIGRAAIERILNGRMIEERHHDGTPINHP
ncbi:DNA polymerase III subunit gamma and tau [Zhihengliuella flava]|uniref:DNA polymerase III subunit gamma/tau n=1 Tax=Zhihengliuella flava TaxID=1285193 RepID=A0A931DE01_9MICC|nr:DNA polymerase-3 subunit gamma/tau [Zhihengliuella flava]